MIPPLLAIFAWPLVSIAFFRRLRLPLAILVTVIGGYLLLPENTAFDLPLLPSLGKHTVPALVALGLAAIFAGNGRGGDGLPGVLPGHWIARLLIVMIAVGAAMTALTNPDMLFYGATVLPAIRPYDAGSNVLGAIMMLLPLLVARRYLAGPDAHVLLLRVLCIAAVGYAFLALFEVRMSPQLNRWVYGFFPHSWAQHVRGGAFRPVIFLAHGLLVGIFLSGAVLAAIGLARIQSERRSKFLLTALWLGLALMLSKNLGAVFITVMLLPVALFLPPRGQLIAAASIAGLFLLYPVARSADILPIARVVTLAQDIDPERAASFITRLENEDRMLAKSTERPLFGWGGWGRSRVYDETGRDITIADGAWVITIGVDGWVGYVGRYGLLVLPIFLLLFHKNRYRIGLETSVLTLILAGNLIDMVPNSSNTPLTWLIAGVLWGRLELGSAVSEEHGVVGAPKPRAGYRRKIPAREPPVAPEAATLPPRPAYSRQVTRTRHTRPTAK
ncbi:MAG: hypothetical protein COW54_07605 [Rhodobacteraceae bacterium CG17_big_fil_post_rev_8_21_14_2_50_63_15]|nr:MAG: hypothetical protein COW54_07605 [Rhodobacteraceae bacterium CG17_big_fil_post_rev_8_21_14_2_50_63_15]